MAAVWAQDGSFHWGPALGTAQASVCLVFVSMRGKDSG